MVGFRRRFGSFVLLCLVLGSAVGFVVEAFAQSDRSGPTVAERYQPGPLGARAEDGIANLPNGVEELLGLSVLLAFLYGFRASGLASASGGPPRTPRS